MNYHIVRTNETLEKIANIYNLDITEIKELNTHIRLWNNLIPGLKIKLPEIPENVTTELNDVEPFIEDYYPKITDDLHSYNIQNTDLVEKVKAEVKEHLEEVQSKNSFTEEIVKEELPSEKQHLKQPKIINNPNPMAYYQQAYYNPYLYYSRYYYPYQKRKR